MPSAITKPTTDSTDSDSSDTETIEDGDEIEEFIDEDEYDPDKEYIVRAKWLMDGAKTLAEARECLKGGIEWLQGLEDEGWELVDAVSDDYGFCRKPEDAVVVEE